MDVFNPDRKFVLKVRDQTYYGEFPLPDDEILISVDVAQRTGGVPADSLSPSVYGLRIVFSTLNFVLRQVPGNFPSQPPDLDWGRIPDDTLAWEVYQEYEKKFKAFKRELKKNNTPGKRPKPPADQGERNESLFGEQAGDNAEEQPPSYRAVRVD